MHISHVTALRRSLIGLIVIVALSVVFNYVQIWRGRARIVKQATAILGSDMMRSADSIEYSEHENGSVRFKIRAERLLETRQGKNLLQGIEAFDFNPDGTTRNEIRSQKAEYDRDNKLAAFFGEVRIEMGRDVELRTDSLHYDLQTNVGTTSDRIRFSSKQATGTARGVRYDQSGECLNLLKDVDFTLTRDDGVTDEGPQGGTMRATAAQGYYSKADRLMRFEGNARLESESSVLSGDLIEATFSADDRQVKSLVSRGNSVYQSNDSTGKRTLRGEHMVFGIGGRRGTLERIDVKGQAAFSSKSADGEEQLQGTEIHLTLDPAKGIPQRMEGQGGMQFELKRDASETKISSGRLEVSFVSGSSKLQEMRVWEHAAMSTQNGANNGSDLLQAETIQMKFGTAAGRTFMKKLAARNSVQWDSLPQEGGAQMGAGQGRSLSAAVLDMYYSQGGDSLESGIASGEVVLKGITAADTKAPAQVRRMAADQVEFNFYPKDSRLKDFIGEGHVQIYYQELADPTKKSPLQEFRTSSEKMRVHFNQADGTAQSVSQWGGFKYQDATRTATSGMSEYDAGSGRLVLTESPKITDDSGSTTGDEIEYRQNDKMIQIQGHVRSIIIVDGEKDGSPFLAPSNSSSPNVVTATKMEYWTNEARARYSGTVQMLSENSQLEAQMLQIVNGGERVEAQGDIRHLISGKAESPGADGVAQGPAVGKGAPKKNPDSGAIRIRSANLLYLKEKSSIDYGGGVSLVSQDVKMDSDALQAIMDSSGKKIERATAVGKVVIEQTGRKSSGDQADYYLDPGTFVVTGKPAEIYDPSRGKSAARRLTFFTADDRIMLANQE